MTTVKVRIQRGRYVDKGLVVWNIDKTSSRYEKGVWFSSSNIISVKRLIARLTRPRRRHWYQVIIEKASGKANMQIYPVYSPGKTIFAPHSLDQKQQRQQQ